MDDGIVKTNKSGHREKEKTKRIICSFYIGQSVSVCVMSVSYQNDLKP